MTKSALDSLLHSVRVCSLCEAELTNGVCPVLQPHSASKILIAGQAPGSKVHASGIPFDDPSGDGLPNMRSQGIYLKYKIILRCR